VARVDEASDIVDIVDIDDIALSTNGGFHAVPAAGEYQYDKIQLVEMTARYFWGNEL
jgi:5-methyltetrahydropteroyltriglutamate--homocysteine methyltransferase